MVVPLFLIVCLGYTSNLNDLNWLYQWFNVNIVQVLTLGQSIQKKRTSLNMNQSGCEHEIKTWLEKHFATSVQIHSSPIQPN